MWATLSFARTALVVWRYDFVTKVALFCDRESTVYSFKKDVSLLRRGFRVAHSSVCRVIDLVSGRSCRVGSLIHQWLDIHSLLARLRGFTDH